MIARGSYIQHVTAISQQFQLSPLLRQIQDIVFARLGAPHQGKLVYCDYLCMSLTALHPRRPPHPCTVPHRRHVKPAKQSRSSGKRACGERGGARSEIGGVWPRRACDDTCWTPVAYTPTYPRRRGMCAVVWKRVGLPIAGSDVRGRQADTARGGAVPRLWFQVKVSTFTTCGYVSLTCLKAEAMSTYLRCCNAVHGVGLRRTTSTYLQPNTRPPRTHRSAMAAAPAASPSATYHDMCHLDPHFDRQTQRRAR